MSGPHDTMPPAETYSAEPHRFEPLAPARAGPPRSVINAVRLMIVGAAVDVLSIVLLLITLGNLRGRLERAYPGYSRHRLDDLVDAQLLAGIAIGLAFAVLTVVIAKKVREGRNWARIVAWVLAGLGLLDVLRSLASTDTPVTRIASLVLGLLDVATIVLLVLEPSSRWFKPRPY